MTAASTIRLIAMAAALAAIAAAPAQARQIIVSADDANLQAVLDSAASGDVVHLSPGRHKGPVTIDRAIRLEGAPGAVLEGNGKGNVVTVNAANAVVSNLEIRGSGKDLPTMNAGVFLTRTATGAIVENNRIIGNLYGVYLHGAKDSIAIGNTITGIAEGRMTEAGNGVSLWNAPGAQVIDNDISLGRDGIYTNASKRNVFRGNRMTNVRFAIHYMYTNDSEISGNVSTDNSVGYAIMYSNKLRIVGNLSNGDRDHGLLLNYANGSDIRENRVIGRMQPADRWLLAGVQSGGHGVPASDNADEAPVAGKMRLGPEKCVFIYNANRNRFTGNSFEGCSIGIHFTAGSEGNAMSGNAFINNRNQVKYVGTRYLDWSVGGRGNYWSDNPAFDLDGDGVGDSPYRPNDLVDRVLWTAPQAKILINSPAVQTIRWAQMQFPALLPGGVVDSHPLMRPPQAVQMEQ
ncbi:MAG: nitrous oxide reductase family maturation protein NosD [Phyllobacterium sp.]